jgi:hypothetical protein
LKLLNPIKLTVKIMHCRNKNPSFHWNFRPQQQEGILGQWALASQQGADSSLGWQVACSSSLGSSTSGPCSPTLGSVLSGRACQHSCHMPGQGPCECSHFQEMTFSWTHSATWGHHCSSSFVWNPLKSLTLVKRPSRPTVKKCHKSLYLRVSNSAPWTPGHS